MRLFVGVALSLELKEKIFPNLDELGKLGAGLSIVPAENLHFTLKFLGDVDEQRIPDIIARLDVIARNCSSFSAQLHGLGAFSSEGSVRVVWVGVEENISFVFLLRNVQYALEIVRAEEYHDPIVHLTLARVQNQHNKEKLHELIETYRDSSFGRFTIDRFVLYKSVLGRNGPVYSEVASFYLKNEEMNDFLRLDRTKI